MPQKIKYNDLDFNTAFQNILSLKRDVEQDVDGTVAEIIANVRSLGDEALFRIGNETKGGKTESLWLRSGDVIRLGSAARLIHHGIDRIKSGSSTLLKTGGRINLTLRVVY